MKKRLRKYLLSAGLGLVLGITAGGLASVDAQAAVSPRNSVDMREQSWYAPALDEESVNDTAYVYNNVTFASEDDAIEGFASAITIGNEAESGFVIYKFDLPHDACFFTVNAYVKGSGKITASVSDSTYNDVIAISATEAQSVVCEAFKPAYGDNTTEASSIYIQIEGTGLSVLGKIEFSHYGTVSYEGTPLINELAGYTYLSTEESTIGEAFVSNGLAENKSVEGVAPTPELGIGETINYAVYALDYTKTSDTIGHLLRVKAWGPYRISVYTGQGEPTDCGGMGNWTDVKSGYSALGTAFATVNVSPFCTSASGKLYVRFASASDMDTQKAPRLSEMSLLTCTEDKTPAPGTTVDLTNCTYYLTKHYSSDSTTEKTFAADTDMYYAFGKDMAWGVNSTYTQSIYLRGGYFVYRIKLPSDLTRFYVSGFFAGTGRISASFDGEVYDTVYNIYKKDTKTSVFNAFEVITSSVFDGYVYVKISGNDLKLHNVLEFTHEGLMVNEEVDLDGSNYYFNFENGFVVTANNTDPNPQGAEADFFVAQKNLRVNNNNARYNDGGFGAALNTIGGNYSIYKFPIVKGSEHLLFKARVGGHFLLSVLTDSSKVTAETNWASNEGWEVFGTGYFRQNAFNYTFDLSKYLENNSEYLYVRVSDATNGDGYGGALYSASLVSYTEYKNGTGTVTSSDQTVVVGVSLDLNNISSAAEDVDVVPLIVHTLTFEIVNRPEGSQATIDENGVFVADVAGSYKIKIGAISPAQSVMTPAEITVTVIPAPKVTLSAEKLTLKIGETATLTAECALENAYIMWKGSDSKILNVTSKGVVTARSKGKATVTAYILINGEEIAANCEVTVTEAGSGKKGCKSSLSGMAAATLLTAAFAIVSAKKKQR